MNKIAVLFVNRNSHYKKFPAADCYDVDRDATTYRGTDPIIAHPPCAGWGRLSALSKATPRDKLLGVWAVNMVRKNGGVLEQPWTSKLIRYCGIPKPGEGIDQWGGYTLDIEQSWWGYPAAKRTWLYIVGVPLAKIPPYPLRLTALTHVVDTSKRGSSRRLKLLPKSRRSETVPSLCAWLLDIAELTRQPCQNE